MIRIYIFGRAGLLILVVTACVGLVAAVSHPEKKPSDKPTLEQILRGRALVLEHACGACHGGGEAHPGAATWLSGMRPEAPPGLQEFQIGPFKTRARNLTPDNVTGIGRFSERQIFNALRFGLRPGETPDVEITSHVPGEGNFPELPKYLAPPMPWASWRHMADQELWDIAAYLKHGLKPVRNKVEDSEGPPDFWAGAYTPENIGTYPAEAFPTANERLPE
jgi:mono/diheme cytochrome c family protein